MFRSSRTFRKLFAVLMAAALLWSIGAEACSDWIEHELSHSAAFVDGDDGDHSTSAAPARHDHGCHASHHLQIHLAAAVVVPAIKATLPLPMPPLIARRATAPDLPYHPPRFTTLA
jgi:hypothetical protein